MSSNNITTCQKCGKELEYSKGVDYCCNCEQKKDKILIAKVISKKMMEQYEMIRQTGATDMYNYYGVVDVARILKLKELAEISLEDYKTLLLNFQKLMKHYNVQQPKINTSNEQKNVKNTTDSTVKFHHKKS